MDRYYDDICKERLAKKAGKHPQHEKLAGLVIAKLGFEEESPLTRLLLQNRKADLIKVIGEKVASLKKQLCQRTLLIDTIRNRSAEVVALLGIEQRKDVERLKKNLPRAKVTGVLDLANIADLPIFHNYAEEKVKERLNWILQLVRPDEEEQEEEEEFFEFCVEVFSRGERDKPKTPNKRTGYLDSVTPRTGEASPAKRIKPNNRAVRQDSDVPIFSGMISE